MPTNCANSGFAHFNNYTEAQRAQLVENFIFDPVKLRTCFVQVQINFLDEKTS